MVTLSKLTKDDTKEAAMMFLGILAMWTDCFFDEKAGSRLLKIDEESYEGGDIHYDGSTEALESYIVNSDLKNSVFVKKIEEIFDFAQSGVESEYVDGYTLLDLIIEFGSFRQMFNSRPILSFKDDGVAMLGGSEDPILDILLTVTNAAYARWKLLEHIDYLTLDEIALLAGVKIKSIRNAVSSKGHDRLLIAGRKDDKTIVSPDEAYRWLLTKKGFTGPFLYTEEPPYETYETLSQFRHHCFVLRKLAELEIEDLAKKMEWNSELETAYTYLENLNINQELSLLTSEILLELANFYQSKNVNTFVIEGSRILAAVVAEEHAKSLFN